MDSSTIPSTGGVYQIVNAIDGKLYVGSSINLRKRYGSHFYELRHNRHGNPKLQRAFNKHGESAFIFEILEIVLVPEMLTAREQYWFSKLKPFGKRGYNLSPTAGSTLGVKASEETRKKQSRAKLGKPAHNRGVSPSPETIEKLRLASLGNTNQLGKKHSADSIAKMRQSKIGKPNGCLGTKRSQQSKDKMRIKALRRTNHVKDYIVTSPEGVEYSVRNLEAFCRERQLSATHLVDVIKGRQKQHKGWTARYPPEEAS